MIKSKHIKDIKAYRESNRKRQAKYRRAKTKTSLIALQRPDIDVHGYCDICGLKEPRKKPNGQLYALSVDHNHTTGQPRGLLCSTCNRVLGLLKDNPALLAKLIIYLLK